MTEPNYTPSGFTGIFRILSVSLGKAGHNCIHPQSLKLTIHVV